MSYVTPYFSHEGESAALVSGFWDRCDLGVDAAIYALTHRGITDAILRAHEEGRGPNRILVDSLQAHGRYSTVPELEEAGVNIRRDRVGGSMHNKFIIQKGPRPAVGTGSFNWTKSADEKNAENFVVIRLKYVRALYQAEFDRLWELNAP